METLTHSKQPLLKKRGHADAFRSDDDLLTRLTFIKKRILRDQRSSSHSLSDSYLEEFTSPSFLHMISRKRPTTPEEIKQLYIHYFTEEDSDDLSKGLDSYLKLYGKWVLGEVSQQSRIEEIVREIVERDNHSEKHSNQGQLVDQTKFIKIQCGGVQIQISVQLVDQQNPEEKESVESYVAEEVEISEKDLQEALIDIDEQSINPDDQLCDMFLLKRDESSEPTKRAPINANESSEEDLEIDIQDLEDCLD